MSQSAAPAVRVTVAASAGTTATLAHRTDEELLLSYQRGDPAAFRVLVERHHAPIYRFCLRALRSPEAAADAAQEVFLRVVKNIATWEPKAKFTTWVYTIARNHCIDEARKGRFRHTESLNETVGKDDSSTERIDRVAAETPSQDRVLHGQRLRVAIDDALSTLPDEQRQVFLLREVSGLAFKDIADAVGVGENTVKSRMRYALASLKKSLEAKGFDLGFPGAGRQVPP